MNVLVACEFSGTVRDAFEDAGWNAWSCDILPTESEQTKASGKHYQGNVLAVLDPSSYANNPWSFLGAERDIPIVSASGNEMPLLSWDLMIGHPPCTYLSYAYTGKERYSIGRLQKKIDAYQFFLKLLGAPIEHICLENPMGYAHGGLLPCTQIVEPYYWGKKYGESYTKRTCLWLKNLPPLTHSKEDTLFEVGEEVEPTMYYYSSIPKSRHPRFSESVCKAFCDKKERSTFHRGISEAMARQWTEYLTNK